MDAISTITDRSEAYADDAMTTTHLPSFNSAALAKLKQIIFYKNGLALEGHVKSAHAGHFCDTCRACQEIKARTEALRD